MPPQKLITHNLLLLEKNEILSKTVSSMEKMKKIKTVQNKILYNFYEEIFYIFLIFKQLWAKVYFENKYTVCPSRGTNRTCEEYVLNYF